MLGVFRGDDDIVTLVTELAESDLLDQVTKGLIPFTEDRVMRYTWQLLQATGYLHKHHIGHRDISLENILISFGDTIDGQIRLMDFGQAVSTHTPDRTLALRYFIRCGKSSYTPPECNIPSHMSEVCVPTLAGATPGQVVMRPLVNSRGQCTGHIVEVCLIADVVPGMFSRAVLWGYTVMPVDIFACGVALFILAFQAPPWKCAQVTDKIFKYITMALESDSETGFTRGLAPNDHDIANKIRILVQSWGKNHLSPEAMALLASMIHPDPSRRPTVQECLVDPWFAPMPSVDVPTHPP